MSNPEEGEPRQAAEPQAAPHDVDFQHTYERLAGAPLRVERIMLVGLQRTKSGVVEQELARIKDARTLEEIRDAALRAYEELMALDIFDAVDVVLGEGSKVCSAGQRSVAPVSFAGLTAWQHLPQRLQGDHLWESPTGFRRQPAAASLPANNLPPAPPPAGRQDLHGCCSLPGEEHGAAACRDIRAGLRRCCHHAALLLPPCICVLCMAAARSVALSGWA